MSPRTLPGMLAVPSPETMTPRAWAVVLAYYQAGVEHGIALGRQQAEDDWQAIHSRAAAIARQVAESPSYADLAERRGEHDRAERQRAILRERGIA